MVRKLIIFLVFAVAIWAACGAFIFIGRQFFSMETTLIIHAIGAPIAAALIAAVYFRFFGFTGPIATAAGVVAISIALDVFVVAMLIEKSFEMFASVIGVWLPQALVFTAIVVTGAAMANKRAAPPSRLRP